MLLEKVQTVSDIELSIWDPEKESLYFKKLTLVINELTNYYKIVTESAQKIS